MEEWQLQYLDDNLPRLIQHTVCNAILFSEMRRKRLFSEIDCQALEATPGGPIQQAYAFYNLIRSRRGAYDALIEALGSLNQNGAAEILKQGRNAHNPNSHQLPQPLTLINNSLSFENGHSNTSNSLPSTSAAFQGRQGRNSTGPVAVTAAAEDARIEEEYLNLVRNGLGINGSLLRPNQDMHMAFGNKDHYKLPFEEKGLALLVNIKYFDKYDPNDTQEPDLTRNGSEKDLEYLRPVLKGLGYNIFEEDKIDRNNGKWCKENLMQLLRDFKLSCFENHPKSIVVFIGSHGELNKIFTSDKPQCSAIGEHYEYTHKSIRLYEDIVREFYHDKCFVLNGKPKLFLVSACQNFEVQIEQDGASVFLEPGVSDMIVCTAQVPGFSAYRNPVTGTWLIHCLTFVMMKYAREKSLQEMLAIASSFMEKIKKSDFPDLPHGQIPDIRSTGMKELYFFMNHNM